MIDQEELRLKLLARRAYANPGRLGWGSAGMAAANREPGYGLREAPIGPFSQESNPPARSHFLDLLRRSAPGPNPVQANTPIERLAGFLERMALAGKGRIPLSHAISMIQPEDRFALRATPERRRARPVER